MTRKKGINNTLETLTIRVTLEMKKEIENKATQAKMDMSKYVRQQCTTMAITPIERLFLNSFKQETLPDNFYCFSFDHPTLDGQEIFITIMEHDDGTMEIVDSYNHRK